MGRDGVIGAALGAWAALCCVGVYQWAVAADDPGQQRATGTTPITSQTVSLAVSDPEVTRYLSFKLVYVPVAKEDGATADGATADGGAVPIEASARDVLIAARERHAALLRAPDWRDVVEQLLRARRAQLGVGGIDVIEARRSGDP